MSLETELLEVNGVLGADEGRLQRIFETEIDAKLLSEALQATGTATIRRRRLPAESAVMLVLGMAIHRGLAIRDVAERMSLALPSGGSPEVAPSALTQARARLGSAPLEWLFNKTASRWCERESTDQYRGLSVYAADGTTLSVADTPENDEHFGRHRSGSSATESAYPMMRLVWVTNCRSRLVLSASVAPYGKAELTMARELLAQLPSSSLVLLDRLYHNSPTLLPLLHSKGRHFLVRAKSNSRWTVVEELGKGDEIVEVFVSSEARSTDESLPRSYRVRAISTRTKKNNYVLLTSLLDADSYPASELRELYRERWEVELAYDELKTDLMKHKPSLRSRTVAGTYQELWAMVLTYNLIRLEMAVAAKKSGIAPRGLSFVLALTMIADLWNAPSDRAHGRLPERLREVHERLVRLKLPPRRSERYYERVVKRKESPYPRKRSKSNMIRPN
jgi:hypothetical protein